LYLFSATDGILLVEKSILVYYEEHGIIVRIESTLRLVGINRVRSVGRSERDLKRFDELWGRQQIESERFLRSRYDEYSLRDFLRVVAIQRRCFLPKQSRSVLLI